MIIDFNKNELFIGDTFLYFSLDKHTYFGIILDIYDDKVSILIASFIDNFSNQKYITLDIYIFNDEYILKVDPPSNPPAFIKNAKQIIEQSQPFIFFHFI